jgi:hypothetical protein
MESILQIVRNFFAMQAYSSQNIIIILCLKFGKKKETKRRNLNN